MVSLLVRFLDGESHRLEVGPSLPDILKKLEEARELPPFQEIQFLSGLEIEVHAVKMRSATKMLAALECFSGNTTFNSDDESMCLSLTAEAQHMRREMISVDQCSHLRQILQNSDYCLRNRTLPRLWAQWGAVYGRVCDDSEIPFMIQECLQDNVFCGWQIAALAECALRSSSHFSEDELHELICIADFHIAHLDIAHLDIADLDLSLSLLGQFGTKLNTPCLQELVNYKALPGKATPPTEVYERCVEVWSLICARDQTSRLEVPKLLVAEDCTSAAHAARHSQAIVTRLEPLLPTNETETTDSGLQQALEQSEQNAIEEEAAALSKALLDSKVDLQRLNEVLLVRLTTYSDEVETALLASPELGACREAVVEAGSCVRPSWGNGCMMFVPIVPSQLQEWENGLKAHHIIIRQSDLALLQSALRRVCYKKRPKYRLEEVVGEANVEASFDVTDVGQREPSSEPSDVFEVEETVGVMVENTFLHYPLPKDCSQSSDVMQSAPCGHGREPRNPRRWSCPVNKHDRI